MAKRKAKKDGELPRCICGAFASIWLHVGDKRREWVPGSCRQCQEKAVEATLVPGGALRFTDDMEMEFELVEVTEDHCAVAVYTGRARRIKYDKEDLFVAIFKVLMEDGSYQWYAQPLPEDA